MLDAPPTIGNNIQRAIDEIAAGERRQQQGRRTSSTRTTTPTTSARPRCSTGTSRASGTRRRGGCCCATTTRPGRRTRRRSRISRTLEIGGERIDLAWHGANHSPDNIVIHLPDHDTLMLIDIVNPGWAPIYLSNLTEDIPGYLEAPANALAYSWKHFIGGHNGRLGTRDDVTLHQQYMADIADNSRKAIDSVDPTRYFVKYGENVLGSAEGLPGRDRRHRSRARDREVHRRDRGRRRVHREHDVPGDAVDPPRPRLRLTGASLMASAPGTRPGRRPPADAAERGVARDRLPAVPVRGSPVDRS